MRNYRLINRNKYHAVKHTVNGESFDSKKEANRYRELLLLERAGEITDLKRQEKFVLIPAQYEPDTIGKRGSVKRGKLIERECSYIADFMYIDKDGNTVVEDVKGYKGGGAYAVFVIKRKMMLWRYDIRVKEI